MKVKMCVSSGKTCELITLWNLHRLQTIFRNIFHFFITTYLRISWKTARKCSMLIVELYYTVLMISWTHRRDGAHLGVRQRLLFQRVYSVDRPLHMLWSSEICWSDSTLSRCSSWLSWWSSGSHIWTSWIDAFSQPGSGIHTDPRLQVGKHTGKGVCNDLICARVDVRGDSTERMMSPSSAASQNSRFYTTAC